MTQLRSHENHLQCSIEQRPNGSFLKYQIGQKWTEGLSVFDAATDAALKISQRFPPPYIVPLSGGVDSEFLALSFIKAEIPFTPLIMQFANGYNDFDTTNAYRFCTKNNLVPKTLSLDLDRFFKSEKHLDYADLYQCRSPQLATHLWMMEQIEGSFIFPYNPLPLFTNSAGKLYIAFPLKLYHTYDLFLDTNNRAGVGNFHTYTPDMIYSFFQLPMYLEMLFDSDNFFKAYGSDNYFTKCELYRAGSIPVVARKYKATGFEIYRAHLNKHNGITGNQDYFDKNYREPMEKISKDSNRHAYGDVDLKTLYEIWLKR